MSAKILVRGLIKRYGATEAVRGIDLEVAAGTIFGLLGPNGAGKTSILECLLGLRQPDAGSIQLDGIDALADPARLKRRIGAALQSTELPDAITPREALRLFGSFYRERTPPVPLLERFGLTEKADAAFATLSAGQRQRLALALAIVHAPDILFLDEPTAGLDPASRRDLHDLIRQLRAEGRTILLTTHYLEEAHSLCDRIAVLDAGRIVATGRPDELIARSRVLPRVTLRTAEPVDAAAFLVLPGVRTAEWIDGELQLEVEEVGPAVVAAVHLLESRRNALLDLRVWRPTLEDTFLELTAQGIPRQVRACIS